MQVDLNSYHIVMGDPDNHKRLTVLPNNV